MIHPGYRNELKYLISPSSRQVLSRQLERVLRRDPHAIGKGYAIRSLYFDTAQADALQDNLMGSAVREKYRLRLYNEDPDRIRLEKKVRHGNQGFKVSAQLTRQEVESILKGSFGFLKDHPEDLLREFYVRLRSGGLSPCLVVNYFREPFLFDPGNVRVTLDYDLAYSRNPRSFLDFSLPLIPEFRSKCLLEVKYDEFLPSLIPSLLEGHQPMRTAHSKYVTGRFLTGA